MIGIYLLLWLITLVIVLILIFISGIDSALLRSLFYVSSAGGIGGVVYLIRSFYKHIFEKNFRTDAVWWYLSRPFLSIVMGALSYVLIVGGLISIGNGSDIYYEKSVMFYCGIAFLAGFSFTQFTDKIEEVAKTLFAKARDDK